jgi:hypothetical protein
MHSLTKSAGPARQNSAGRARRIGPERSWHALKWAANQRAGSLSANAVLRVMADHANQQGQVWICASEIAAELDTSKPTVLAAQTRLRKCRKIRDTGGTSRSYRTHSTFSTRIDKETDKRPRCEPSLWSFEKLRVYAPLQSVCQDESLAACREGRGDESQRADRRPGEK